MSIQTNKKENFVNNDQNQWCLNDFVIGKIVGEGQYGKVYKVKEKKTGTILAMKVMYIERFYRDNIIDQLEREINIHSRLRHPNILRLYGAFIEGGRVHVLLEWANRGNLYNYFNYQPNKRFREEIVIYIISQVLGALLYCHKFNIMHRDLKPENILLTTGDSKSDVVAKLGDFGWAIETTSTSSGAHSATRTTYCGTIDYMAPELGYRQQYDMRAESWSFGVLIYELLTGLAGDDDNPPLPLFKSYNDDFDLDFPEGTSEEAKDLVFKLLRKNPSERLPLEKVVEHPFLKSLKYRNISL